MNPQRLIGERVRKRVAQLAVLATVIDRRYELTGDREHRVRVSEVAEYVAAARDVDVSTPLRRDVRQAAKLLGFTRINKTDNVCRYVGVRRRASA